MINIIFSKKISEKEKKEKKKEKEEKMMLCLKEKSNSRYNKITGKEKKRVNFNLNIFKNKNEEIDQSDYEVSTCPYQKELYDQVINKALWVIESKTFTTRMIF